MPEPILLWTIHSRAASSEYVHEGFTFEDDDPAPLLQTARAKATSSNSVLAPVPCGTGHIEAVYFDGELPVLVKGSWACFRFSSVFSR